MKYRTTTYVLLLLCVVFASCDPQIEEDRLAAPVSNVSGEINAHKYMAIGDEFSAGFHDNELFLSGQLSSLSSILSSGLILIGTEPTPVAYMHDELGLGNRVELAYHNDCNDERGLTVVPIQKQANPKNLEAVKQEDYKHFAIPQLSVGDLSADDYEDENPYWKRVVEEGFDGDVLDYISQHQVTFFTVFLGLNDALDWAKKGGYNAQIRYPLPTPEFLFEQNYRRLLDSLKAKGAKGVVANIPRFTDFPFFKIIPRNALVLTKEQADQLNTVYTTNPFVEFKEGANNFVVRDGVVIRHITESERILFSVDLDSVKCGGYGSLIPFGTADVLLQDEIDVIDQHLKFYNDIIDSLATNRDYPVLDLKTWYQNISKKGVVWNGVKTDFEFVTGGFFSLDGIFPTPRGSALLSNAFTEKINEDYGTTMHPADPNAYRGITLP